MSKLFTIFGNPVSHSISPLLHNFAIKSLDIDACYTRIHLKDGNKFKDTFLKNRFDGANVTVPFKEDAFRQCDEVNGIANDIKAVNTVILKDDKLIGYNTDAPGFFESIKEFKGINSALVLGAGGTAKAIANILKRNGINCIILNRSEPRLEYFIKNGFEAYSWDTFKIDNFDIIVNTTSAGLKNDILPLEEKLLINLIKNTKYCADVIYNKQTPFLKMAKKLKKPSKDGSDMLLYQAVLAFEIFFDGKFKKNDIEKCMRQAFKLLL